MFKRLTRLFAGEAVIVKNDESDPAIHRIEFDMMLKGNLYKRSSGNVRQCSVTVEGATRLVTSGDVVSQKVYDALVDFNAIAPIPPSIQDKASSGQ